MCGVRVAGSERGIEEGRGSEKESKVLLGEMSTLLIYAPLPPATPPSLALVPFGHCTGEATAEEAARNLGEKGRIFGECRLPIIT